MKVERVCACGTVFVTTTADIKRGWGKSCSKSCAAAKKAKQPNSAFKQFISHGRKHNEDGAPEFSNAHQFDNCEQD